LELLYYKEIITVGIIVILKRIIPLELLYCECGEIITLGIIVIVKKLIPPLELL